LTGSCRSPLDEAGRAKSFLRRRVLLRHSVPMTRGRSTGAFGTNFKESTRDFPLVHFGSATQVLETIGFVLRLALGT